MMLEWILWYIWEDFYATHVRTINFLKYAIGNIIEECFEKFSKIC